MPDVRQILPHGGRAPGQRSHVEGRVSALQPLPANFTDPLFVVLDDFDPNTAWRVDDWPVIHGATLPAFNAEVHCVFNKQHVLRVTWWHGAFS